MFSVDYLPNKEAWAILYDGTVILICRDKKDAEDILDGLENRT